MSKNHPLEQVLDDCNKVLEHFAKVVAETDNVDKKVMQEKLFNTMKASIARVSEAFKLNKGLEEAHKQLLVDAKDIMGDWLDKQFGGNVTENEIFSKLPRYWEEKYHEDMDALNVGLILNFIFDRCACKTLLIFLKIKGFFVHTYIIFPIVRKSSF